MYQNIKSKKHLLRIVTFILKWVIVSQSNVNWISFRWSLQVWDFHVLGSKANKGFCGISKLKIQNFKILLLFLLFNLILWHWLTLKKSWLSHNFVKNSTWIVLILFCQNGPYLRSDKMKGWVPRFWQSSNILSSLIGWNCVWALLCCIISVAFAQQPY